jgi:hypothetical protein
MSKNSHSSGTKWLPIMTYIHPPKDCIYLSIYLAILLTEYFTIIWTNWLKRVMSLTPQLYEFNRNCKRISWIVIEETNKYCKWIDICSCRSIYLLVVIVQVRNIHRRLSDYQYSKVFDFGVVNYRTCSGNFVCFVWLETLKINFFLLVDLTPFKALW